MTVQPKDKAECVPREGQLSQALGQKSLCVCGHMWPECCKGRLTTHCPRDLGQPTPAGAQCPHL